MPFDKRFRISANLPPSCYAMCNAGAFPLYCRSSIIESMNDQSESNCRYFNCISRIHIRTKHIHYATMLMHRDAIRSIPCTFVNTIPRGVEGFGHAFIGCILGELCIDLKAIGEIIDCQLHRTNKL